LAWRRTPKWFACPWDFVDELLKGLDGTQRGGGRYPIPVAMRGTVTMPKHYQDLLKLLEGADSGGDKPR